MSNVARVAGQAANSLVKPLQVEDVFSTYLYTGTGSDQTITNGIDLSGEGGMTWIKRRNAADNHQLTDSERGYGQILMPNATNANQNLASLFNLSTTSSGFTIGSNNSVINNTSQTYASWTFRKAPKFFDVVTYTGDGTTNDSSSRLISHNLGSTPGFYIVKRTDGSENWRCFHRGLGATKAIQLNGTGSAITSPGWWADVEPTNTHFSVTFNFNATGANYVVYLFAHNDGDGEFGPDGDADIIKCGSYTGNGSTSSGPHVDLGFEPQWILVKNATNTGNWSISDSMRGFHHGNQINLLYPHLSNAEAVISTTPSQAAPTPTGFQIQSSGTNFNQNGGTYIYIAIRRGTAVPESATDVFAPNFYGTSGYVGYLGAPADMHMLGYRSGNSQNAIVSSRLVQSNKALVTSSTASEITSNSSWDNMLGVTPVGSTLTTLISWTWRRAPKYMDVVAFTGTGSAGTHNHNLTVPAEMMWVKSRAGNGNWFVYHSGLGATKYLFLNETSAAGTASSVWNDTAPTSSVFSVGASVNQASASIAYLFATLAGISKVGSVTHSGTTNVDCGFSSGARLVLLKRTDATGDWYVWDSVRGIVAGNDPYLLLNSSAAEVTNTDYIDPLSSGFTITSSLTAGDYIFYAIA